jgi:chromosome partitioning protein
VKHFPEMLDLVVVAGEYECLEPCRLDETIVRGRRRGRNRSLPQDVQDPSASGADSNEHGAVTLIGTAPVPGPEQGDSAAAPSEPTSVPAGQSPARRFRETISDVATAHAELDNVLPPTVHQPRETHRAHAEDPSPVAPVVEHVDSVAETVEAPAGGVAPVDPMPAAPQPSIKPATEPDQPPRSDLAEPVSGSDGPHLEPQAASGNSLPRVMAVANQKGGVGKTTTSVNLGAALAEIGFRVLVIDLDPQGNATTGLGIDARNFEISMYDVLMRDSSLEDCVEPTSMKNLFVAPATIALAGAEIELVPAFSRELKLKKSIESILDDFDYVLIDCPPSLGLITVNALAAADEVLVPIQCEYYALEGLSQLMRNVHLVASNLNPKLDISTIVLTMYDARTKLSDQVANEVRLHFGSKVCRNVIPRTVRLSEAPSFGQPITAFDPVSRGAIAYRELAKEVSGGTS